LSRDAHPVSGKTGSGPVGDLLGDVAQFDVGAVGRLGQQAERLLAGEVDWACSIPIASPIS
jgi:hypothetical protein